MTEKLKKPDWRIGRKLSMETRLKMSQSHKKNKHPCWNLGKKLTLEHRKKISYSLKKLVAEGKSNLWKGGITPENIKIRHSLEYRQWRTLVFERDNYICVIGGVEHGNKLNADHIKSFALYPKLRFEISNGRTLCKTCHMKTDNYGSKGRWSVNKSRINKK